MDHRAKIENCRVLVLSAVDLMDHHAEYKTAGQSALRQRRSISLYTVLITGYLTKHWYGERLKSYVVYGDERLKPWPTRNDRYTDNAVLVFLK
jgi:hypothetical protein